VFSYTGGVVFRYPKAFIRYYGT